MARKRPCTFSTDAVFSNIFCLWLTESVMQNPGIEIRDCTNIFSQFGQITTFLTIVFSRKEVLFIYLFI
jgi:hypothetical protein